MGKELTVEKPEILWKDRRRRLGLPLSFTRYEVTNDSLVIKKGFFKTETDEILIYRIMDIRLVRSLWQKIFGVGTITLLSSDKSAPSQELKSIKDSENVRLFLSRQIEKQRTERGISSREFLGADMAEGLDDI
ncbi:MAG: PH domain-containing protein [Clostridiales bacterium]|jgi:uncharacterized membrane protein YdbT with pleckstrin-like domain|nr:PH domain-containing protein [Clostridiales bacterium]